MTASPEGPAGGARLISIYLTLQAIAAALWWGVLYGLPDSRRLFYPESLGDTGLMAYLTPDAVFFVAGSAAAAWGILAGLRWARPLIFVVLGAAAYTTLYLLHLSIVTNEAWAAPALMLAATGGTGWCALKGRPNG